MRTNRAIATLLGVMIAFVSTVQGAEYFVAKQGSDENNGGSRETAFLTIQKGVDALNPGDTLTVGPGEYFENVKLREFGDLQKETLIRAKFPGTVLLRGDQNADLDFSLVPGQRFVYVADCKENVLSVHEADTLSNLALAADAFALEFGAGRFFHDTQAKKLYLSSSDFQPADEHHYTIGVRRDNGFHLFKCRRVVLDGLAASAFRTPVGDEVLLLPTSGFLLHETQQCVVRRCTAFFNNSGITINSGVGSNINQPGEGKGNLVEDCRAYANRLDGIVAYNPSGETIRNCRSFLNETYGARFYGGRAGDTLCLMEDVIAWGNPGGDFWTKGNGLSGFYDEVLAERCIAFRGCMFGNFQHGLVGGGAVRDGERPTTINLPDGHEEFLSFLDTHFADPINNDFRFQASSPYAKQKPGGTHMGPSPYKANVYYVQMWGDDTHNGLSMESAWKTPAHAVNKMKPGDTLYIAPGTYGGDLTITGRNIKIIGRGTGPIYYGGFFNSATKFEDSLALLGTEPPTLKGVFNLTNSEKISFEHLRLSGSVQLANNKDTELTNCILAGPAVQAKNVQGLHLSHNLVTAPLQLEGCSGVSLSANLYTKTPAVQTDSLDTVVYSSYNSYPKAANCWKVGGKAVSLGELQPRKDAHSVVIVPWMGRINGEPFLSKAAPFNGRGPLSTAIGPYREWQQKHLDIKGPFVKSTTGTSADIEWWSTVPVNVEFSHGDTPACANKKTIAQNSFYSYSLTGLRPGQKYYAKVTPTNLSPNSDPARRFKLFRRHVRPIDFTPRRGAVHQPTTFYVTPEGNNAANGLTRATAWKSLQVAVNRVRPGDTVLLGSGVYPGTFYFRTTGEQDKPITLKAVPGDKVWINGMKETLPAGFILYGKHHYRIDSLYFNGYRGIEDNVGGKEGGAIYARNSDDLQITRCSFSRGWGRCMEPHECRDLLMRNCVFMGSMEAVMVYYCPNITIENSVFIEPLITHLHVYARERQPASVKRCIFGENTRHKVHVCPVSVDGAFSDNCYYMRWSQYDRTVAQGKTLPELHAAGDTGSLFANPMMPGAHGFRQGWQQIDNDYESKNPYTPIDFNRLFATNPEVILRDIGLQPEAFRDFHFWKEDWPYDKEWAAKVKKGMSDAEALSKAGQHARATNAYVNLVMSVRMSDRFKTEVIDRAAQCAAVARDYERAMTLAGEIPLKPFAVRRQMAILVAQKKFDELLKVFSQESLEGWFCPETEEVMADAYYYRGIAYARTDNLEAAESDLRMMVDKGGRLQYSPGPSILAVAWKRLGDFYRTAAKDEAKALEAYRKALETKSNPEICEELEAAAKAVAEIGHR